MDSGYGLDYNTYLIAPGQEYASKFADNGPACVTTVPAQEDGYVMPGGYRFSDGYSMEYQPMDQHAPVQSTFECDNASYPVSAHQLSAATNYSYPPPECVQPDYSYAGMESPYYQEVLGTETAPQMINDTAPLTTEFFANNAAFQRLPLSRSRAVFRRRRQGDPMNEWSNAFLNEEVDPCEVTPCCTN
ncbi:photosensitized INA-labeled protein PHIL1, putative [Babesia caballi]|uniref:Photosensitized INA-labeled protein PHIL1, putative n=1 Tax=Babesia caballi TaxID=5871 RepID=A0AAV4LLG0_BABCB|nr:photosensitized INA-labeled protein PHIL1, putative [Babesia caballi]